jgi:hypothetical protein
MFAFEISVTYSRPLLEFAGQYLEKMNFILYEGLNTRAVLN